MLSAHRLDECGGKSSAVSRVVGGVLYVAPCVIQSVQHIQRFPQRVGVFSIRWYDLGIRTFQGLFMIH